MKGLRPLHTFLRDFVYSLGLSADGLFFFGRIRNILHLFTVNCLIFVFMFAFYGKMTYNVKATALMLKKRGREA